MGIGIAEILVLQSSNNVVPMELLRSPNLILFVSRGQKGTYKGKEAVITSYSLKAQIISRVLDSKSYVKCSFDCNL